MLVDDDETLLEILGDHLSAAGYRTLTASNGPEGLRLATDAEPDLVVLPGGMPGAERLGASKDVVGLLEKQNAAGRMLARWGVGSCADRSHSGRLCCCDRVAMMCPRMAISS